MIPFCSCDWGTTSFRLRLVHSATGTVLQELREPVGTKALFSRCAPNDRPGREAAFGQFLSQQLNRLELESGAGLNDSWVVISGMASSSVGWRELPYARTPVDLLGTALNKEIFALKVNPSCQVKVCLISGIQTVDNILRGEETELIGLFCTGAYAILAQAGIAILPGTHSKHIQLRAGNIVDFRTYMTGELFDVLASHSLLRASVELSNGSGAAPLTESPEREAFTAGVSHVDRHGLAASFFHTRVRSVLGGCCPSSNHWFLSGLLIGAEIADLRRCEPEQAILLAAPDPLSSAYQLAFETLGFAKRLCVVPPAETTRASIQGHRLIVQQLQAALDRGDFL